MLQRFILTTTVEGLSALLTLPVAPHCEHQHHLLRLMTALHLFVPQNGWHTCIEETKVQKRDLVGAQMA